MSGWPARRGDVAALLARALSIGALGSRWQLVASRAAPRVLRALSEARAVVDAEAPEMSEAALHRHQRDARCRVDRAPEEALACTLEAPRAQELHRRAALPATEARLDGAHAPPGQRRELGEGDGLQSVAREVVLDSAEVARLRSDRARVELLGMAVRLAQDHVEQEPLEPAVGDDRGAQRGATLVQLGDEKIDEAHRAGAEFGADREARVEEERRATRVAEERGERCLHRGAIDLHLRALISRLQPDRVIALWLGHESPETTQIYVEADLKTKEQALQNVAPAGKGFRRFQPNDALLAFLDNL